LVYKDKSNKLLQVIEDESQKQDVVLKAHLVGHEGVSRTLARIKECYYWPGLKSDVEKVVKTCLKCQCYWPSPIPSAHLLFQHKYKDLLLEWALILWVH